MWILYLTLRDQVEDLWTSFSWTYGPLLFLIIIIIYLFVCLFFTWELYDINIPEDKSS